jgi:hypothetical protein
MSGFTELSVLLICNISRTSADNLGFAHLVKRDTVLDTTDAQAQYAVQFTKKKVGEQKMLQA